MAYIPKEHEKYDLLPECRAYGGEVFEYPCTLISKAESMGLNFVFPYNYDSFEEYFAAVDKYIEAHKDNAELVSLLLQIKERMREMNRKEEWSVLRYVGENVNNLFGLTHGKIYYWPTTKENPVYQGVVDDEEFTSYMYPTEASLWEILEDPTGMAFNTIYKNGQGSLSVEKYDGIMSQLSDLKDDEKCRKRKRKSDFLKENKNARASSLNDALFDLQNGSKTHFYFIVQKTSDAEKISDIARKLLGEGCRDFHFYGRHEPLWHASFDSTYVDLSLDLEEERVAMTVGYDTLEDFSDEFISNVRFWHPDEDHYLIYDDGEEFERLLKTL